LGALKKRGLGLLLTDHNVRATLEIVDRAYIIDDGQIRVHGRAQEVLDSPEARRIYLGENFRL
jgi:lipopolysaccharide export system ATP-binding protein